MWPRALVQNRETFALFAQSHWISEYAIALVAVTIISMQTLQQWMPI